MKLTRDQFEAACDAKFEERRDDELLAKQTGPLLSMCVECGPNVRVDEDGCCKSCGNGAMGTCLYKVQGTWQPDVPLVDQLRVANAALRAELATAKRERDAYRAMVCDLLASAHSHPTGHPTMTKQWNRARELLKNGPIDDALALEPQ